MKYTENYKFKMPDGNDYVSVDDINDNFDAVDKELAQQKSDFNEHTHTASDVGIQYGVYASDCNTATEAFTTYYANQSSANAPTSDDIWYIIENIKYTGGMLRQIAYFLTDNRVYQRFCFRDEWSAWSSIFVPLDKVVNNFTTTVEGYVADARTVKSLKDSIGNLSANKMTYYHVDGNGGTLVLPLSNHCAYEVKIAIYGGDGNVESVNECIVSTKWDGTPATLIIKGAEPSAVFVEDGYLKVWQDGYAYSCATPLY